MTSRSLVVLTMVALACLVTSCLSGPDAAGGHGTGGEAVGLTVFPSPHRPGLPSLIGSTLTGRTLTVSSYAGGAPLVINVWASWCSPCRRELPLLARVSRRGVRVLGIDERDTASRARAFARGQGASYPSLLDPQGRLLAALRLLPQTGIPSTLVVDRDGHVAARVVGPLTLQSLHRALARAGA